jgi:hypothetical protein
VVDAGQLPVSITATVRLGDLDNTGSWTFTRSSTSGITTSIAGATVTITAVDAGLDSGTVTIWADKAGQPQLEFIVAVAKAKRELPTAYPVAFGASAFNGVIINATASAYLRLNPDGTIETSINNSTWTPAGNWFVPTTTGIGSSYRVANTVVGSALTAGNSPTYQSLSSAKKYELSQAPGGPLTYLEKRSQLTIRIAGASDDQPLAVGYADLYVFVDRT